MAIKSLQHSSLSDNRFYRSMLVGNTAYIPSDEDILAEEVLPSSQATVTFSNLGTLAAGYQHLQIRATARTDRSGSNVDMLNMTFNSVTSGSYKSHSFVGTGSIVDVPQTSNSNTYMYGFRASAATATSDSFGAGVIDILDAFETSKYTTVRGLGGTDTQLWFTSGLFMSTNAVDSITLDPDAGSNILTGSRFTLIGLK